VANDRIQTNKQKIAEYIISTLNIFICPHELNGINEFIAHSESVSTYYELCAKTYVR